MGRGRYRLGVSSPRHPKVAHTSDVRQTKLTRQKGGTANPVRRLVTPVTSLPSRTSPGRVEEAPRPGVAHPTHGWRWYRVDSGRLYSPIVGRIPLPRNGALGNVYFIPRAEHMWPTALQIASLGWYALALTFGRVEGPFEADHTMPRVGSLKSTRYQALTILASAGSVDPQHYDIPVVDDLLSEDLLLAVEREYAGALAP